MGEENKVQEQEQEQYISKLAYEGVLAREDRKNKRLWTLVIILLVMLFSSNLGWVVYESQYEDVVVTENTQDGEGINIMSGGDVNYGAEK